jgi:hypothetical protein
MTVGRKSKIHHILNLYDYNAIKQCILSERSEKTT